MLNIIGAAAGVVAAGAYLKWATVPVRIAFDVGRQVERLICGPARVARAGMIIYRIGARDRRR